MLVDALAFTGSSGIVLVVFNDFQSCAKADAHRQESGSVTMLAAEKQVSHAGGDDYAAQDFGYDVLRRRFSFLSHYFCFFVAICITLLLTNFVTCKGKET